MKRPSRAQKRNQQAAKPGQGWEGDGRYLVLLLLGALLLRLPHLTESLWYDETWYTYVFLKSSSLHQVFFGDVHPPLYPLIMLAWLGLFGDGELAVRLPSLLFGLGSIVLLFMLTKRWFGRATAWVASGWLALSPVHIWYSHEAKNNMLLLLLTLLAVYWLQRAWRTDRLRDWILFVISALAALWTNIFALCVVAALFAWLLIQVLREKGRPRLRALLISGIAIVLGWLPFVWLSLSHGGALRRTYLYLRGFTPADACYLFLIYLSNGNTLRTLSPYQPLAEMLAQPKWLFVVEGFYLLLMVAGIGSWVKTWLAGGSQLQTEKSSNRPTAELLLLYLLIPPILVMAASWFSASFYIERSMIILLPPCAVLIAGGALLWRSPLLRNSVLALLLIVNGWALVNLLVLKADAWTVYKPNPDWQSAASYFAGEIRNFRGRIFILLTTPAEALDYSYGKFVQSQAKGKPGTLPAALPRGQMGTYDERRFAAFLTEYRVETVYLVHELTWSGNFSSVLKSMEDSPALEAAGETGFKQLDIYRFRVKPAPPH